MIAAAHLRDPGASAELTAEAARALNHLSLAPPSAGTPWRDNFTDLYRGLVEVRLPPDGSRGAAEVIGQLARHIEKVVVDGNRRDADATYLDAGRSGIAARP